MACTQADCSCRLHWTAPQLVCVRECVILRHPPCRPLLLSAPGTVRRLRPCAQRCARIHDSPAWACHGLPVWSGTCMLPLMSCSRAEPTGRQAPPSTRMVLKLSSPSGQRQRQQHGAHQSLCACALWQSWMRRAAASPLRAEGARGVALAVGLASGQAGPCAVAQRPGAGVCGLHRHMQGPLVQVSRHVLRLLLVCCIA